VIAAMDERTIRMMAHHVFSKNGQQAIEHVMQCVDEAIECGDEYGFNFWNRVLDVIRQWGDERGQTRH